MCFSVSLSLSVYVCLRAFDALTAVARVDAVFVWCIWTAAAAKWREKYELQSKHINFFWCSFHLCSFCCCAKRNETKQNQTSTTRHTLSVSISIVCILANTKKKPRKNTPHYFVFFSLLNTFQLQLLASRNGSCCFECVAAILYSIMICRSVDNVWFLFRK